MKVTIVGSSDAFGSGGRLQTCFHVAAENTQFLIDCGATSLIGLNRRGIDPNGVSTIFISHLHGDHFAGLVWWLLHAQHISQRTQPLTIIGPASVEERYTAASEALFPNSTNLTRQFELNFLEYNTDGPTRVGPVNVSVFEVSHPCGAPPYALRFEVDGKVIAFSGDTEWVEPLVDAARDADLFLCECFGYLNDARYHLNWKTIQHNIDRLTARKIVLTHMGPDMLANQQNVRHPRVRLSSDGLILDI